MLLANYHQLQKHFPATVITSKILKNNNDGNNKNENVYYSSESGCVFPGKENKLLVFTHFLHGGLSYIKMKYFDIC